MGVDLFLFVEVNKDKKWIPLYKDPVDCEECKCDEENECDDDECDDDENENEEDQCIICRGTRKINKNSYFHQNYDLYMLFGYDKYHVKSFPADRGLPMDSTLIPDSDDWSFISGKEFIRGPVEDWNTKMIENTTYKTALAPLQKSGFVEWIKQLVFLSGDENVRILWYFA